MAIQSINPANGKIIKTYEEYTDDQIEQSLDLAEKTFKTWKKTSFQERAKLMLNLAKIYRENSEELGKLATLEMGKTLKEAIAEVEKSAWAMEYYAENAEKQLAEINIEAGFSESFVRFDPLGVILAVMPWNFPYWQAIRAFAPTVMAGNTMILKHASNVPAVAKKMEELAIQAGFPKGVFQSLLIGSSKVENIINDERVKAITLTGSEYAGMKVAEAAGRNIKPVVLELGGSDPFIILEDADLDFAVENAATARLQNNGQSCIAAKRFIVHESLYDQFLMKFKAKFESLVIGNPTDENTNIGPMVNESGLQEIEELVKSSVEKGAQIITGGERLGSEGFFYKPTIICNITKEMPLYSQEAFGPLASVYKFKSLEEAIEIANDTSFGLGASIWTADTELAKNLAVQIDAGNVYINQIVRSHPHLPFGGVKKSGIGRELSEFGIKEFMNAKTVVVK